MIHLEQVSKAYQRGTNTIHALRSTSLDIVAEDFVAIVGPSGSGKSTLLSIIGGMLAPTSGQIILNGHSLYDMHVKKRSRLRNEQIGFVFQSFNLVPWLSAIENVQLPLCLYGADRRDQRKRALELLERFGLSDRIEHRPAELSAGQQQRVALARTLAMHPRLILADEPTGNLDPESRDIVLNTMSDLRSDGCAIILVTHDAAVSAAAERVFHISNGTVSEVETESSQAA